jgi:hypothetical protein
VGDSGIRQASRDRSLCRVDEDDGLMAAASMARNLPAA